MKRTAAIVVAGGSGERFGGFKQLSLLGGLPLIQYCLETLQDMPEITECVVVLHPDLIENPEWIKVRESLTFTSLKIVAGGANRRDSVYEGIKAVKSNTDLVAVHDAARPFPPEKPIRECIKLLEENNGLSGAIVVSPCTDTIKRVQMPRRDRIVATIPREEFVRAETPQVCRYSDLIRAFELPRSKRVTDEAQILEAAGMQIAAVSHRGFNIKVTTQLDLILAEGYLSMVEKSTP